MSDTPSLPAAPKPAATVSPPLRQGPGPFAWLCCGCLILLLLIAVGVAVASALAGMAVTSFASGIARNAVSPAAHRERAISILRPRELPDGYTPVASLRVPFVLQAAALAQGTEGLFLYLDGSSFLDPGAQSEPDDWLRSIDFTRRAGVSVELGDQLGEERFTTGALSVVHRGFRGAIELGGRRREGVLGVMRLDCQDDDRFRAAFWIAPEPDNGSLDATPADPLEAAKLLKHFEICD